MRHLIFLAMLVVLGCGTESKNNTAEDMGDDMFVPDVGDEADAGTSGRTETWLIDHWASPCVGESSRLCLQYEVDGESSYLYSWVDGFNWSWGTTYELVVLVTEVPDPPEDGSSLEYSLVELVEETDVDPGTQFTWVVNPPPPGNTPYFTVDTGGVGELLDGRTFRCDPVTVCDDMTTLQTGTEAYEIEFRYDDPITEPLVATSAAAQPPP